MINNKIIGNNQGLQQKKEDESNANSQQYYETENINQQKQTNEMHILQQQQQQQNQISKKISKDKNNKIIFISIVVLLLLLLFIIMLIVVLIGTININHRNYNQNINIKNPNNQSISYSNNQFQMEKSKFNQPSSILQKNQPKKQSQNYIQNQGTKEINEDIIKNSDNIKEEKNNQIKKENYFINQNNQNNFKQKKQQQNKNNNQNINKSQIKNISYFQLYHDIKNQYKNINFTHQQSQSKLSQLQKLDKQLQKYYPSPTDFNSLSIRPPSRKSSNNYPLQFSQFKIPAKPSEAPQSLSRKNISFQSYQIALQYLNNSINQPSQQLILKQKEYYQKKYRFSQIKQELPMCLVVLSYNNIQNDRYKFNLNSLFRQDYSNYQVIYIDDHSKDNTGQQAQKYINKNAKDPSKFKVIINSIRKTAMGNNYLAAQQYCDQDSIFVVGPDGDDGLIGTQTLKLFNYFFQKNDIWVAYAQHIYSKSKAIGTNRQINQNIKKDRSIRKSGGFYTSHLKAFYTKLWKKVKVEDLLYSDNKFYDAAQDLAIMYPIIQMAGQKVLHIYQLVYIYIQSYSGSQSILKIQLISKTDMYIRTRPLYPLIQCLYQSVNKNGEQQKVECSKASDYLLKKKSNQKQLNQNNLKQQQKKLKQEQKDQKQMQEGNQLNKDSNKKDILN